MTKAWVPMVASTVLNDNGRLRKGVRGKSAFDMFVEAEGWLRCR